MNSRGSAFFFSTGAQRFSPASSVWYGALCLLLLAFALTSVEAQCKCKMPSGNTYDISRLPATIQQVSDPNSVPTFYYYYKPCTALPSTSCGGLSSTSAVCQEIRWSPGFSEWTPVGDFKSDCSNWAENVPGNGVLVTFRRGLDTLSDVNFICGTSSTTPLRFVREQPIGQYHFEWTTSFACPVGGGGGGDSGGLSWGWILIIIFCCLVVVYLVGGVLVNRFWRQQSGWDMIPQREFWISVPGLVWDGLKFTWKTINALIERLRGNSYSTY